MQVAALIEGYLDAGGSVTLICRESTIPDHPLLSTHRLRIPGRPFLLTEPLFILLASLAVTRHRQGLLHSTGAVLLSKVDLTTVHFCHAAYASLGLPTRAERNTVWHRFNAWAALRLSIAMEHWCYRPSRTRMLVGPSEGVVNDLARFFAGARERSRVIHNGIDRQRFCMQSSDERVEVRREVGIPSQAFVAIFVGGDWKRKGLAKVIEAIAFTPDCYLLVVGDGDRASFQGQAERCGVGTRVKFAGTRHDVERMYGAADVFVFPSEYEVASLVTYEAAASGLPLLVSRINGTDELITEGENGWFVASAHDIARHLTQLSQDPELRDLMACAARRSSESYTWPSMVAIYRDTYRELAANRT